MLRSLLTQAMALPASFQQVRASAIYTIEEILLRLRGLELQPRMLEPGWVQVAQCMA